MALGLAFGACVHVYMVAVAQYEGRRCMALVPSVGLLLHSSIAVDE